jgi:uncharacterized membrane protein
MKWVRAIVYNIILMIELLLSPFIPKIYESHGIETESFVGVFIIGSLIIVGQLILLVIFYISAIRNKDLKDLTFF